MATLALAAVGAAAGSALFPAGISVLGATLSAATIGGQIGALAGSVVDQALFGSSGSRRPVQGPRLTEVHVTASTEGAPIPRIYGRVRLGGQVIWADAIEEVAVTSSSEGGSAKGGLSGGSQQNATEYKYYASFAVGLCEGEVTRIGRIWADGREVDQSSFTMRLHGGSDDQPADSLIVAREGADSAPAYRGVAYVVFERLALEEFGNRIPQLSFEVYRAIAPFGAAIKGIVLIPGSGEFVYATEPVTRTIDDGVSLAENAHTKVAVTDWAASIDELQASLPNVQSVSLVVSWFGTDLRAGSCEIRPGVETDEKVTTPIAWSVAGETRSTAYQISRSGSRPAYGGTPSDQTVIAAIRDLKDRGYSVVMTPFILMDVPAGNALPDPYGGSEQPAFPWRGRITCHPAPGQPGSPDQSAAAAAQVAAFVGTAAVTDFTVVGETVIYSGPNEWSFRRMVLHQAHLALAAGGVDAFVIGTEMRGLTAVRSAASTYPFVAALVALASDVKTLLGPGTKVIYAADWSEYFGHQPADGSGDVYFHLDPLWASASIDAIGIDLYWPLADWRDGRSHLDYDAGARSVYDGDYLRAGVRGGEGFDWYYASDADRAGQVRTLITDGADKPWVFRYKDLANWWSNAHYNRPGGIESGSPTAWVPQSKPIWLMEIGCPAIDKGANQPNVFVDPKSSENAFPYFSRGVRDDHMQRQYLAALIEAFDWTRPGYVAGANPVSTLTGDRMVPLDRMHVYCWDARPYPAFPFDDTTWGDGGNWTLGHWLNGRIGNAPLADTVARILSDAGFADFDAGGLSGTVSGYAIDRVMAPRDALQPLELAYFFDSVESEGRIAFRHRGRLGEVAVFAEDTLVEDKPGDALLTLTRGQETDLPASAKIRHVSAAGEYRQAVAEARRLVGASGRVSEADVPIVLDGGSAATIAETWLYEAWVARERSSFTLPPSALAIEPGDVIKLQHAGANRSVRVVEVGDHGAREIEALGIDLDVYGNVSGGERPVTQPLVTTGSAAAVFLDLPLLSAEDADETGYAAFFQQPWPGGIAIFNSEADAGYRFRGVAPVPAIIGATLDALAPGPRGRLDKSTLRVKLSAGALASVTRAALSGGANAAAIRCSDGSWEVLQFSTADLIAPLTYRLSGLLRAQLGTDAAMQAGVSAGARFVLINSALTRIDLSGDEIGLPYDWRYGPANRDVAHALYRSTQHAYAGVGRRPYAPVHVRGRRTSGDLLLSWVRRTRRGGDSWEAAEVPLAEESERYEVDIIDGSIVRRTIAASTPSLVYSAAEQTADFGAPQSAVSVRVYQLSQTFGRGTPSVAVV